MTQDGVSGGTPTRVFTSYIVHWAAYDCVPHTEGHPRGAMARPGAVIALQVVHYVQRPTAPEPAAAEAREVDRARSTRETVTRANDATVDAETRTSGARDDAQRNERAGGDARGRTTRGDDDDASGFERGSAR